MSTRQLIICCDGTNNTLTANDHDTNVLKTYALIASGQNPEQILYYDPGVGAPDALPSTGLDDWFRNKCDRLWGLASGRGIYENIGQAYLFLMKLYQPGDQIYLFGFSRGAFTVRCVSGMVHLFGILDAQHEAMLPTLLRVYFSGSGKSKLFQYFYNVSLVFKAMLGIEAPQEINDRKEVAEQIRTNFCSTGKKEAAVFFIGAWDTVSSVGVPGFSVSITSSPNILNKRIQHVRHALALDEHRAPFQPRLYEQNDFGEPTETQSLRQRWFRGNHSDIGGGFPEKTDTALSRQAWHWMMEEARQCGLQVSALPSAHTQPVFVHDENYSMPWWAVLGLRHRRTVGLDAIDHAEEPKTVLRSQAENLPQNISFPKDSVWHKPRNHVSLLMAAGGCVFFSLLYGACFMASAPDLRFNLPQLWQIIQQAWQQSVAISQAQLFAVLQPDALAAYKKAIHPYAALWLLDTGLIASYAFLLGRCITKAFAYRIGFTDIGLQDRLTNTAGRLLPWLVSADLLENLATLLVFSHHCWPLYFAVSVFSAAKFVLLSLILIACVGLRVFRR
jgi:uncharacterized protein (DUF2235 family)